MNLEEAAQQWAEQFKTGEWFERLRKKAFIAGANYSKHHADELTEKNDALQKRIIELNKAMGGMQLNIDSYQEQVDKQIAEITELESRYGQLAEKAKALLHLHTCEQEGLSSGKPSFADWMKATEELSTALASYEVNDGWISVKDRLPTSEDAYPDYDEVLTVQHGRKRPTMMKYWEVKHCPFTHHWMKVPAAPQFNYEQNEGR